MTQAQRVATIIIVIFGTILTRFLPFIIFPENKKTPKIIIYLGNVLPYAITGLLVIYCLKDAVFSKYHSFPELIAITAVIIIHKWKKNTLLSIGIGTITYMILLQNIFN